MSTNAKRAVTAVAAIAVLGLAYAGTSVWLGTQTQSRYEVQVERLVAGIEATDPTIKTTRSYQRGLFDSEARLTISFRPPAALHQRDADAPPAAAQPIVITIENHIHHGPLAGWRPAAAVIETRLGAVEGLTDAQRALFAQAFAPHMRAVVGFAGGVHGRLVVPAGEFANQGYRAQWQQLDYTFAKAADGKRMEGNVRWPQFQYASGAGEGAGAAPTLQVRLSGLSARFESEIAQDEAVPFGAGQATGTIEGIDIEQDGKTPPLLALNGMDFKSVTTRSGKLLSVTQSVVGKGALRELPIESLELRQTLENIDAGALQRMQTAMASAQGQAGERAAAADAGVVALTQLLDAQPAYKTSWRATLGNETGALAYSVAFGSGPAPGRGASPALPPALMVLGLIQRAQADATLRLPKNWPALLAQAAQRPDVSAESITQLIAGLQAQGWLREDADAWFTQLNYAGGQVRINGKPMR